ncbi:uncharacterized protein FTOL_04084 [Fusarium torulosum]|uniref:Uncharacterized protein n=1 Tax=Fusarium torulosum TaxID=33205 RepID=A0AAE8SFT2_9HYPO|nr:uncharacterized protein FTOL_04084 [Fusarium torulosum]
MDLKATLDHAVRNGQADEKGKSWQASNVRLQSLSV